MSKNKMKNTLSGTTAVAVAAVAGAAAPGVALADEVVVEQATSTSEIVAVASAEETTVQAAPQTKEEAHQATVEAEQKTSDAKADYDQAVSDEKDAQEAVDAAEQEVADLEKEQADTQKAADEELDKVKADAAADVEKGTEDVAKAEEDVKAAESEAAGSKQEMDDAKAELDKAVEENGDVTEEDVAEAQKAVDGAQQEVDEAQKVYDEAKIADDESDKAVEEAHKAVDKAEADLDVAEKASEEADAAYEAAKKAYDEMVSTDPDIVAAKEALDQAIADKEAADVAVEQAKKDEAAAQAAVEKAAADKEAAQAALDKANADKAVADKELASAQDGLKAAQDDLAAAQKEVAEAEKAKTDVESEKSAAESELKDAEEALAKAQVALEAAKKCSSADAAKIAAAQTALDEANKALEAAQAVIDKGSIGFFESRNEQAAIDALTKCVYASYTHLGAEGDATNLENMKKSLEIIALCNAIRESLGLPALEVSDYLMATSQANANYSSQCQEHSNQYDYIGENIAWNTVDDYITGLESAFIRWYSDEKKFYDDAVKAVPNGGEYTFVVNGVSHTVTLPSNWTNLDDYQLYLAVPDFYSQFWHWRNIVKQDYTASGAAYQSNGQYGNTFVQDFQTTIGGNSIFSDRVAFTEYETAFMTYYNDVTQALESAQKAVEEAENVLKEAQEAQKPDPDEIAAAEIAVEQATKELQAVQQKVENLHTTEQKAQEQLTNARNKEQVAEEAVETATMLVEQAQNSVDVCTKLVAESTDVFTQTSTDYDNAVVMSEQVSQRVTQSMAEQEIQKTKVDVVVRTLEQMLTDVDGNAEIVETYQNAAQQKETANRNLSSALNEYVNSLVVLQSAEEQKNKTETVEKTMLQTLTEKQQSLSDAQQTLEDRKNAMSFVSAAKQAYQDAVSTYEKNVSKVAEFQKILDDAKQSLDNMIQRRDILSNVTPENITQYDDTILNEIAQQYAKASALNDAIEVAKDNVQNAISVLETAKQAVQQTWDSYIQALGDWAYAQSIEQAWADEVENNDIVAVPHTAPVEDSIDENQKVTSTPSSLEAKTGDEVPLAPLGATVVIAIAAAATAIGSRRKIVGKHTR